jgi:hypothetical protein
MPTIIKPLGAAVSVTTANTVNGSTLVRCYAATDAVVTVAGSVNGSFLMGPGRVDFIEKASSDTIAATSALSCTPVAYKA